MAQERRAGPAAGADGDQAGIAVGARPWDDPGVSSPLLSVVVPAYNSADFLLACLETLVVPGGEVEVVVVDDGSSDATGEVAEGFASAHEGFRVIRQENKGHGGAVNTGVAAATGTWIKVVDSDDALDPVALERVLTQLREWRDQGVEPDLVVTNFVYMRADRRPHRHAVRYPRILPQGRVGSWSDVGRFRPDQYLMMHALMYRTEVLRNSGMRLPEHCFYVDNLYSFEPLIHVDSLVYINEDLYLYTIGREGQSVSDEVIVTRLDQHDRVNALMLKAMPRTGEVGPELEAYLIHIYLMSCVVITTMALRSNTPANLAIKDRLWARMEKQRPDVYTKLRRKTLGRVLHLPGRAGRTVPVLGYHVARRVLALN